MWERSGTHPQHLGEILGHSSAKLPTFFSHCAPRAGDGTSVTSAMDVPHPGWRFSPVTSPMGAPSPGWHPPHPRAQIAGSVPLKCHLISKKSLGSASEFPERSLSAPDGENPSCVTGNYFNGALRAQEGREMGLGLLLTPHQSIFASPSVHLWDLWAE